MREIEWPPGSGRVATYSDAEYDLMTALLRRAESGEVPAAQIRREIDTFHDLKYELGATMVENGEPEPKQEPEQPSLFQG
jgi:hypothetical protein